MGVLVAAHIVFAIVAIPLALIDQKTHRLPDVLTLPLWALSAVALGIAGGEVGVNLVGEAVFGSALTVALLWVLAEAPGKPLGFGDVKLGGVIGLQLGVYGVQAAVSGLMLAFIIGGIVAVWLVLTQRVEAHQHIAFGPYLLIAGILGMVAFH